MSNQKILICSIVGIISIMIGSSVVCAATAQPIIGTPVLIPTNPAPKSTIKITVDVSGDDITFVKVNLKECNRTTGICFNNFNVTMGKISDITYAQDIVLTRGDASYITYWIAVQYGSLWKESAHTEVNLSIPQQDHNQTNGSGNNTKSPGFEIPVIVSAVAVALILIGRKRSR